MSQVIRVVAAVVDQYQLTLYKEDGTEHIIKQGNPELRRVLGIVQPIIQDGLIAEVDLGGHEDQGTEYKDFEKKTKGLVQFFKVMKSEAEKFLSQLTENTDPVSPLVLGSVPTRNPAVTSVQVTRKDTPAADAAKQKQNDAVSEILANAVPTSSEAFSAPKADQHDEKGELISEGSETIIAVVGNTVVPGVEKLAGQFEYAAKEGNSTVGMERFLARIGAVIKDRGHSVQDLLKFLERGDLPIAEDGTFIAYKILRKKDNAFVDCHTGKVTQRVGSYVHMDVSLVDHNRSNECSNGLHVARRGYIGKFFGDVCTLIKVAPEDVIAVPKYDANKMRVCGYHIIDVIDEADYQKLRKDNSMTDTMRAKIQLGKALAGEHIGITERVKITGHYGEGVEVTKEISKTKAKKAVAQQQTSTKRKLATSLKEKKPVSERTDVAVDAKAVAKEVAATKASGGSARVQKVQALLGVYNGAVNAKDVYNSALALLEFKKAAKVSWDKLGVSPMLADQIASHAATEPVFDEVEEPVEVAPRGKVTKAPAVAKAKKPSKPVKPTLADAVLGALTPKQQEFANLYAKVQNFGDKKAAAELLSKKKASKKSWDALALPKQAGEVCEKLLAKAKK